MTICFLTNYDSAASEVINNQVYADGFLRKPVDVEKLREKLDAFYRMSGLRRFELRKGKSFRTVYAEDIMFIEADGKRSTIHFADHCESFNYLISELETLFEPSRCFCRIHRSFIVNLQFVKEYDGKYVILKNGTDLPLKSRGFKTAYADYILNH